jgi:hypothetical protein
MKLLNKLLNLEKQSCIQLNRQLNKQLNRDLAKYID